MFSTYNKALRDRDLLEEGIRVLSKAIPDLLFDLRGAGEAFDDTKQLGLNGETPRHPTPTTTTTRTCHRSQHGWWRSRGTTSSAR